MLRIFFSLLGRPPLSTWLQGDVNNIHSACLSLCSSSFSKIPSKRENENRRDNKEKEEKIRARENGHTSCGTNSAAATA